MASESVSAASVSKAEAREEVEKKVQEYYGKESTYEFYSALWGEGNIHFGYFPELESEGGEAKSSYEDGSYQLTMEMVRMAGIERSSKVLDLGCGYGKPILDVQQKVGCRIVGVDLSEANLKMARLFVHKMGIDSCNACFFQGSFLSLPSEVLAQSGTFTHVISQAAICHAHADLCAVFANVCLLLKAGGLAVINDCTSDKKAGADTREHVYERMSFPLLVSTAQYLSTIAANGFEVVDYKCLDKHFLHSHDILRQRAVAAGASSLALAYAKTYEAIEKGEYGYMNVLARKKPVEFRKSGWIRMNDGNLMPAVGFGLYLVKPEQMEDSIRMAYESGYRMFDGASLYGNEKAFGDALEKLKIPRESIFVTSKVWNTDHGFDDCIASCKRSLAECGLDYFDLFMVHWPTPGTHVEAYRACQQLVKDGLVRSIGVSNYIEADYSELAAVSSMQAAVNQLHVNPLFYKAELVQFFKEKGVVIQAYKALERGGADLLEHGVVKTIAAKRRITAAQVCLKWSFQHDFVTLVKSVNRKRIVENMDAFDETKTGRLSDEDMALLDSLSTAELRSQWLQRYEKRKVCSSL